MKNNNVWTYVSSGGYHILSLKDGSFADLHSRGDTGVSYLGINTRDATTIADVCKDAEGKVCSSVNPEGILNYEEELLKSTGLPRHREGALRVLIDGVHSGDYEFVDGLPAGI